MVSGDEMKHGEFAQWVASLPDLPRAVVIEALLVACFTGGAERDALISAARACGLTTEVV